MSLSFIIPCYNYGNLIDKNYKKLKNKIKNISKNYELIFINDGSIDDTFQKLMKIKENDKKVKIINNRENVGKSYSLIKGISKSKFKNIVIYDCDLPYFEYLETIIKNLKKNHLVYINRKSKKSKLNTKSMSVYQISRFLIGRLMCLFLNFFLLDTKIGDTQAGLKAFIKPKNFIQIKFISKKFFFDAELMIIFYKLKKTMKFIPVNYSVPKDSTIKIFEFKNIVYLIELLKVIFFYKVKNQKFFNKIKI